MTVIEGHRIYFDVITARAYATTDDTRLAREELRDFISVLEMPLSTMEFEGQ